MEDLEQRRHRWVGFCAVVVFVVVAAQCLRSSGYLGAAIGGGGSFTGVEIKDTTATVGPPHILHVVADDLGWADVGWANANMRTHHLDKMRSDGIELRRFYTAKECGPSRASLLTGRYPWQLGYYRNPSDEGGVPLNVELLPEALKRQGYATHIVGKYHLGFKTEEMTPTKRGFDTFFGFYHWGKDYYSHTFPPKYKGPHVKCRGTDLNNSTKEHVHAVPGSVHDGVYSADLFSSEARRLILQHDDVKKPMYLYLALQLVHDPYPLPPNFHRGATSTARQNFTAMVEYLDLTISKVVDALKEKGMWNNTLLLFHSDNGGELPFASQKGGGAGCNSPLVSFPMILLFLAAFLTQVVLSAFSVIR